MKRTIGVMGGDRRQAELARLLAKEGHRVCAWGVETLGTVEPVGLEEATACEVVILPLPLCREEGVLNCGEETISTRRLFRYFSPQQRILAGQIESQQYREAELCGLTLEDYFLREEVTVANAAVTAEGAIQTAMEQLERSLLGMDCLVLGFGRIGKLLSLRLAGLGARVTVTARKSEDLAWIRACGWKAVRTHELNGALGTFDVVFNTIPSLILEESLLRQLPEECLCVDLASRRGIDAAAAEGLGLKILWARGLPGRLKPQTAAEILRDAIHTILLEG